MYLWLLLLKIFYQILVYSIFPFIRDKSIHIYSLHLPPVYLHLIFEISSVTRFFFNFKISSLKINLISKLIFAGYTGSKNQVRTRKKIKFDSKSIFFQVCNKLPNWHFKNQAQIDTASVVYILLYDSKDCCRVHIKGHYICKNLQFSAFKLHDGGHTNHYTNRGSFPKHRKLISRVLLIKRSPTEQTFFSLG